MSICTDFVKKWEGFRREAYQDGGGVWTIGYGTIRYWDGRRVLKGQEITLAEAEKELSKHLDEIKKDIKDLVGDVELNENQEAALGSFVYNVGLGAFASSTLLVRLHTKAFDKAADEFLRWNKDNGKVVTGLTNRRAAERELFLK